MPVVLTTLFRNKKTRAPHKKHGEIDVKLLQLFLVSKNEENNFEDIPIEELNEYLSDFIISITTKDRKEYEPSSLRSLLASFERHISRKNTTQQVLSTT